MLLNHVALVTNVCKMDNHPPARRPHKSPAHTVKDRWKQASAPRFRCSDVSVVASRPLCSGFFTSSTPSFEDLAEPFVFQPVGFSSKGAAHDSAVFASVNTPEPGILPSPSACCPRAFRRREPHILACSSFPSTSFCKDLSGSGWAWCVAVPGPSRCGARILHVAAALA